MQNYEIFNHFFWAFAVGQAVNYIGSALVNGTYDFKTATIIGLIAGLICLGIGAVVNESSPAKTEN